MDQDILGDYFVVMVFLAIILPQDFLKLIFSLFFVQ